MHDRNYIWRSVGLFCFLTALLSTPFWVLIANAGEIGVGDRLLLSGLTWCPALAALVVQKIRSRNIAPFGWNWGAWRFNALGYFIPLAYIATVYMIVWTVYPDSFFDESFFADTAATFHWTALTSSQVAVLYTLLQASAGMVGIGARALGEEIGWRGFLVPNLAKVLGFGGTALLSGVVWAVWHFPVMLLADYHGRGGIAYSLTIFTIAVVADSFLYAWLRLRSGSLWPCVLLHASFNVFSMRVFDALTVENGIEHVVGEFGFALMLANVAIVIPVWMLRGQIHRVQ